MIDNYPVDQSPPDECPTCGRSKEFDDAMFTREKQRGRTFAEAVLEESLRDNGGPSDEWRRVKRLAKEFLGE